MGVRGTFDELLVKVRFEEAKRRETTKTSTRQPPNQTSSVARSPGQRTTLKTAQPRSDHTCFSCRGSGHFARECTFKGRGAPVEARGRNPPHAQGKVPPRGNKPANLRRQDHQVSMLQANMPAGSESQLSAGEEEHEPITEVEEVITDAVERVIATMYGIQADLDTATLGPTPMSDVSLNDYPTLLDTGSPTSIVSQELFLKTAAKKRPPGQTPAEWGKAVTSRLQPTTVSLRSYGGCELRIVGQVRCRIAQGDHGVDILLQVQNDAPVE